MNKSYLKNIYVYTTHGKLLDLWPIYWQVFFRHAHSVTICYVNIRWYWMGGTYAINVICRWLGHSKICNGDCYINSTNGRKVIQYFSWWNSAWYAGSPSLNFSCWIRRDNMVSMQGFISEYNKCVMLYNIFKTKTGRSRWSESIIPGER